MSTITKAPHPVLSSTSLATSAMSVETRDIHLTFGRNKVLRGVNLDVRGGSRSVHHRPVGVGQVNPLALREPAARARPRRGAHRWEERDG